MPVPGQQPRLRKEPLQGLVNIRSGSQIERSIHQPESDNDGISVGCLPFDECPLQALQATGRQRADLWAVSLDPQLERPAAVAERRGLRLAGRKGGSEADRMQDIERHRDRRRLRAISISILAAHKHIAAELLHTHDLGVETKGSA